MPKYIRGRYGFSQRSGRKVRYDRLVEDGHNRGLFVDVSEADEQHPQEREITPIDNPGTFLPIPPLDDNVVRADYGRMFNIQDPGNVDGTFVVKAALGGYIATVS